MKRFILVALTVLVAFAACKKHEDKINEVKIQALVEGLPQASVEITLVDKTHGTSYTAVTGTDGNAVFNLVAGLYEASSTFYKEAAIYNGINSAISVTDAGPNNFTLNMITSTASQVIIKELYIGGCMDDADKQYLNDCYVILYNNSPVEGDASKFTFGMSPGANSNATNPYFKDGQLTNTDFIPAWNAVWWFQTTVTIPPYSQIVIAINGAIDHSATVSRSVDLSKADYVFYDPDVFNMESKYPAPSASIPTANYLQTYCYAQGKAWPLSNSSPAFFVFSPEITTAEAFVSSPDNIDVPTNVASSCAKVPVDWVKDGIEVYNASAMDKNNKRFLSSVDAGYVVFTNKLGYSIYRNVDKEATEALAENEGKLVYDYAGGTEDLENGTTDPSGIDAEASIAKGAHIIYKDTNNSSNDFHQRKVASIKK